MRAKNLKKRLVDSMDLISAMVEKHGAQLKRIQIGGALSKAQRRAGKIGKITLFLNDVAPGWRAKDHNPARQLLIDDLSRLLSERTKLVIAVNLQANYSCLVAKNDEVILRRNDEGCIVGAYFKM